MKENKTAVLLVNLGTPNSYHPKDVKKYLTEFLLDNRVTDISWLYRQFLVRGIIVPRKYKESASFYKKIWKEEGSPLIVYGRQLQSLLQKALGESFQVELAMRYQNPSLKSILQKIKNHKEMIILPLFPHYASATTGTVHEEIMKHVSKWNVIPKLTFINSYPTSEYMIQAFCELARKERPETFDHFLISFHGLPERHLTKADAYNHCLKKENCCKHACIENKNCYSAQCHLTAKAIVENLNIPPESYSICFQSRLGKDPWLQPYISDTLKKLADAGKKKILVICPSFICDCIETTHEIGIEYAEEFKTYGGEQLQLVRGLNDHPLWVKALTKLVTEQRRL